MNDKTERTIEVLEELQEETNADCIDLEQHGDLNNEYTKAKVEKLEKYVKALDEIITALQTAKTELPEKKNLYGADIPDDILAGYSGFNQGINLCTPILAKLKLENEELKKAVETALDKEKATRVLKFRIEELKQELTARVLKFRIEELKQELTALKDKITDEGIYLTMLSTELKKDEERERTYAQAIVKELKGEK